MSDARAGIYYWKCDRAAAFHGTAQGAARHSPETAARVRAVVEQQVGAPVVDLRDGGGQGNHLTFVARMADRDLFVRVEDGPEGDDYLTVESLAMELVRDRGVPTPRVQACDSTRTVVPFAWQILDYLPHPDLNRHFKAGTLDGPAIARRLGDLIARWQEVPVEGFGPFRVDLALRERRLVGRDRAYPDYHFTRLEAHLGFLAERSFLDEAIIARIRHEFSRHRARLELAEGCLVHKDLALWNVLGTERDIVAVIDWDDCIAGDPMDDLSLLGCFHDGAFLRAAFEGYAARRPLPPDAVSRFWLHLLRNMIFKAVIRLGAGYFNQGSSFFLSGAGGGASLREQTLARIERALRGLEGDQDPFSS